jgi:hypothetical protein
MRPSFNSKENLRYVAGLIARIQDVEPPSGLTEAVMRRISPKRLGWPQRVLRRMRTPFALMPTPVVSGAVAIALVAGIVFGVKTFTDTPDTGFYGSGTAESGAETITFVLEFPSAQKVAVIGSFNQWSPEGFQMRRDAPQAPWQLTLRLPRGQYTYAFLIDDRELVPDPRSLWHQADGFGNLNSTLIVANGKRHGNDS